MTSDKCPHDAVAAVCHNAAVLRMCRPPLRPVLLVSVVEARQTVRPVLHRVVLLVRAHLPEVPEAKGLVFSVGNDVAAVSLGQ